MKIGLGEHAERFTASVSPRIQRAFSLFADGMYYSTDLNCTVWEFAVTIKDLRDAGLSDNDVRWLMRKHYVEHAVEVTQAGDESRSFRPSSGCILSDRACFVWTEKARALVFADPVSLNGEHNARNGRSEVTNGHCTQVVAAPTTANLILVPTWDRDRQELRWGEFVIKQFKVPSPNQETILAAFEEEHWPPRIDDPLSPQPDQEPKRTTARHHHNAQPQPEEPTDSLPRRRQRPGSSLGTGRPEFGPKRQGLQRHRRERYARSSDRSMTVH